MCPQVNTATLLLRNDFNSTCHLCVWNMSIVFSIAVSKLNLLFTSRLFDVINYSLTLVLSEFTSDLTAGHVPECRRCDRVLLRVAEEPEPCQLRPSDLQVREGLQLPPAEWVLYKHTTRISSALITRGKTAPASISAQGRHSTLR